MINKKSILLFFVFLSAQIYAQLGKDSLFFSLHGYRTSLLTNSFEKQLNTYNFNALLKHFYSTENIFFGIKENFYSTITKTAVRNIRDEQYLSALGQYKISDRFRLGLHFSNNIYSDDRKVGLNHASLLSALLFIKYSPAEKIEITPFGGFSQNNQIGIKDRGIVYGTEANIDKYEFGDFEITSLLKYQNEDILPRKNTLRVFNFDLKNTFEKNFTNTVSVNYWQQRRDLYLAADPLTRTTFNIENNIQSRTESNFFIQDRIKLIPSVSPFSFDLLGKVAWRNIDRNTRYVLLSAATASSFDTKIEEFRLEFSSIAEYIAQNINISFRFSFSERDEKHQPAKLESMSEIAFEERKTLEEQKNNSSQLSNITLLGQTNISDRSKIIFSFFHRKLIYNTPSQSNFDDRDELLSIARLLYEHKFNPFFKTFVNFEGSLNKIVYILAERSANNNIKRTVKFSSGGIFSAGNLTSSNSAEVSANYTVFDYEELNPNFRSYSFRQLAFRDSTNYIFSRSFRLFFSGYTKISEQGDFKWSSFSSKPLRYLSEIFGEPKFLYNYFGIQFGLGLRYFSISTFNYKGGKEKIKVSEYSSIGPLAEINYVVDEKITLRAVGWYEFINAENNLKREMVNLSVRLNYSF